MAAVDTDLAQLTAISSYGQVKASVVTAQERYDGAALALASAQAQARVVDGRHQKATTGLGNAKARMAHLALAAYTGEAYVTPGSAQALSPNGTVSTPGGQDADVTAETEVLLGVVVEQTERSFTRARTVLRSADAATARAASTVAGAQTVVRTASQGVTNAEQALAAATRSATVAGVAAQQAAAGGAATGTGGATATGAQLASTSSPPGGAANAVAPPILGPSAVTAPELSTWYATTAHQPNTTVPITQLAADYVTAGTQTGVAADLAFAQSIIETGFFSFPTGGQLTATDNNFAGIGACDSCSHGWSFPDALTGVTAQEQLLEAYASPKKVPTPLIGPVGVGGCCTTWVALAGKWATSKTYGVEILTIYKQILDWVIPRRLVAAGLAAPGSVPVAAPPAAP